MADPTEQAESSETTAEEQAEAIAKWLGQVTTWMTATVACMVCTVLLLPLELLELVPGLHWWAGPALAGFASTATGLVVAGVVGADVGAKLLPTGAEARSSGGLRDEFAAFGREVAQTVVRGSPLVGAYVRFCGLAAQLPRASTMLLVAGASVLTALAWMPRLIPAPVAIFAGVAAAMVAWARAIGIERPDISPPAAPAEERKEAAPASPLGRISGRELVEQIRWSAFYRNQITAEINLDGLPPVWRRDETMRALEARYASLTPQLAAAGITDWSESQARAAATVLHRLDGPVSADFLFEGESGSGRSTLALALMLGAMQRGEASVYCVSGHDEVWGEGVSAAGRGPHTRFDSWLTDDQRRQVRAAYSDRWDANLDLGSPRDVYFTDARLFCTQLASSAGPGAGGGLVERLRYVVIDHPERLDRNELARMRVAIARLRFVAEMLGRTLSFIVIIPPIDNAQAVAKWLLNHDQIEPCLFDTWPSPADLFVWQAPYAIERTTAVPRFERSGLVAELQLLLTELVAAADERYDAEADKLNRARIAVIDAQRTLGPESRRQLHQRCIEAIRRGKPHDTEEKLAVDVVFDVLGGDELRVSPEMRYDVIVTVGIGSHPGRLIARLRNSVQPEGAMVFVSDESPEDLSGVATLAAPGWRPDRAHLTSAMTRPELGEPRLLVPEYSVAVMQYELAAFLARHEGEAFPMERLLEVFPTRGAHDLLEQWRSDGRVETFRGFRASSRANDIEYDRFVRARPGRVKVERWRLPWGCVTRDVLEVFDLDAGRDGHVGHRRDLNTRVDYQRLFIDLYPGAFVRDDPNTLHVRDLNLERVPGDEGAVRRQGELVLDQPAKSESIMVRRQRARFDVAVVGERLAPAGLRGRVRAKAGIVDRREEHRGRSPDRKPGPEHLASLGRPGGREVAWIGQWAAQVHEVLRDVVTTHGSLISASHNTVIGVRPGDLSSGRIERTYETGTVQIVLPSAGAELGAARGFANLVERYLQRRFIDVENTLRLDVMPPDSFAGDVDPLAEAIGSEAPRLMLRSLHAGEFGAYDSVGRLLRSEWRHVLAFARDLLDRCDCHDGCSACCGRLGTITEDERRERADADHWLDTDVHSRAAALALVAVLDGHSARPSSRGSGGSDAAEPAATLNLNEVVREIVGTPRGKYRDGGFHRALAPWMTIEHIVPQDDALEARLADCRWAEAGDDGAIRSERVLGYYDPNKVEIVLRVSSDRQQLESTVLHEFVHNWQYEGRTYEHEPGGEPVFDHSEHGHRSEALDPFCERKLVIEGLARWAQQQHRTLLRRSPTYRVDDAADWDEYKVGYFYIEGIVSEFGVAGLFEWLRYGERWGTDRPLIPCAGVPAAEEGETIASPGPDIVGAKGPSGLWAIPPFLWLWRLLNRSASVEEDALESRETDGNAASAPAPVVGLSSGAGGIGAESLGPDDDVPTAMVGAPAPTWGTPPASRSGRLQAPFTHREALTAFGLLEEATTGRFDGLDILGFDGSAPAAERAPESPVPPQLEEAR